MSVLKIQDIIGHCSLTLPLDIIKMVHFSDIVYSSSARGENSSGARNFN